MDLSRVIIGQIVTEKAERLKGSRTYTLKVANQSTKIDVKAALKRYYDVDALDVRVMRVGSKSRDIRSGVMEKRHPYKKMIVRLDAKSKPLDIAAFKV
ncbi:50S ribosomal protein L23 [Patescibacteria group bacterium]|nr:50S ribosomal protein L23 [Patescibacteria group bacterium]MBU1123457.1 50S ribosomal protein L23 [Patescibacteria group bacterium]MBU1911788.1 50S ribosomal protein L23 [Patescibacteria group bacterium]